MKRWILRHFLSAGDVLMLTAAVRDLHAACPGAFVTDVRTPFPQLWENNPYVTRLEEKDAAVENIECHYPLIHRSNTTPHHFIHGFVEFLTERTGTRIRPTSFKGDIHLSAVERAAPSRVASLTGLDLPFWIVVAGGKYDYTIKWWHFRRFQQVVDHFRGKILFVQVGESEHYHPPLSGVLDLRGQCTIRELINLAYHSAGVLCPVTFLMHLAAAVELKSHPDRSRPCVVVAGGREPPQWEAYPAHQFIHTVGALSCCASGGCWRARTVPLGDGDEKDRPESLCADVVQGLPRCMDMITAEEVIRRVDLYFTGGACRYLGPAEARAIEPWLSRSARQLIGL
jgi:ADP-heptose:LPS heptosyltransferase